MSSDRWHTADSEHSPTVNTALAERVHPWGSECTNWNLLTASLASRLHVWCVLCVSGWLLEWVVGMLNCACPMGPIWIHMKSRCCYQEECFLVLLILLQPPSYCSHPKTMFTGGSFCPISCAYSLELQGSDVTSCGISGMALHEPIVWSLHLNHSVYTTVVDVVNDGGKMSSTFPWIWVSSYRLTVSVVPCSVLYLSVTTAVLTFSKDLIVCCIMSVWLRTE